MLRPRFSQILAISSGLFLGSSGSSPTPVFADSTCALQVEPANPETAWQGKAQETEKTLRERSGGHDDCRSIRIEVQPEGNALLTFTTTDGRIAVRLLHTADEIPATVEALLVTLPVEKPLETQPEPARSPPQSSREIPREKPSVLLAPPVIRQLPQIVFNLSAGVRVGLDEPVFSSAIGGQALVLLNSWELGFGAEVNPSYGPMVDSAPAAFAMRSLQGNFLVGRRFIFGSRILRLGGSLGFALVHEEMDNDPLTKGRIDINAFQPRIGTYAATVVPRKDKVRFVMGLYGDMALWGLRDGGTNKRNLPNLSRFGLGISLGMEIAP